MDFISKIQSLKFPLGQYVVFGSVVMEIHGIRKARDIDILITEELYEELKNRGWKRKWFFKRVFLCKVLVKDNIEVYTNLFWKKYRVKTKDLIQRLKLLRLSLLCL